MPLNIDLLQILLHALNFVILAGGLTFLLYKPVCKFLDERKKYYENLERENESARTEIEAMKAEYEQSLERSEIEIADKKAEAERRLADEAEKEMRNKQSEHDFAIWQMTFKNAMNRLRVKGKSGIN